MTQPSVADQVADVVGTVAAGLYRGYSANESRAVAQLARLRNSQTRPLGSHEDTWWIFERIPDSLRGTGDRLNHSESAIFAGVGLYALHQQSGRTRSMHVWGIGLGTAVRRLGAATGNEETARDRFVALGCAQDLSGRLIHLRGLVVQLRSHEIALDHGALAADLYKLQFEDARNGVRQRWARELYRSQPLTTVPHQADEPPSGETPEKES